MRFFRWLVILVILALTWGTTPAAAYSAGTYAVAFSPDGQYAAAGWENGPAETGNVRVWSVHSGTLIADLDCITDHVFSLAFSPDRKYLACGGYMGIVLYDTTKWSKVRTIPSDMDSENMDSEDSGFLPSIGDVQGVMFTPDSRYVLSDSSSGARLWNVRTGELVRWFWEPEAGMSAILSPDGRTVLTLSETQGVWLWDVQMGQCLQRFAQGTRVWPMSGSSPFSIDSKQVLIGDVSDGLHLWDIKAGKDIRKLGQGSLVGGFSPDGKYVLGQSIEHRPGQMRVWDSQTGQLLHEFSNPEIAGAFSPDGKLLLTLEGNTFSSEQIFRLYDVSGWKELRRLDGHFTMTTVHAFSPDSRYLIIGYLTVGAQIWNIEDGTLFHTLE